jgi:hypothetical protein
MDIRLTSLLAWGKKWEAHPWFWACVSLSHVQVYLMLTIKISPSNSVAMIIYLVFFPCLIVTTILLKPHMDKFKNFACIPTCNLSRQKLFFVATPWFALYVLLNLVTSGWDVRMGNPHTSVRKVCRLA